MPSPTFMKVQVDLRCIPFLIIVFRIPCAPFRRATDSCFTQEQQVEMIRETALGNGIVIQRCFKLLPPPGAHLPPAAAAGRMAAAIAAWDGGKTAEYGCTGTVPRRM